MGQAYTDLCYHLVFSTKNRAPAISPEVQSRLYDYIGGIVRGERGVLVEIGGMPDHVHLLVRLHPDTSVAGTLRLVKANSSKWLRSTFPAQRHFSWQRGYGAFTVSRSSIERVCAYIRDQERRHRRLSFQEEFLRMLAKHEIGYDPRYIWS